MPTSARAYARKYGPPSLGPYDIDNVAMSNSYALYTNVTPSGALRGFGVPQLVWRYEGHTDMMARALNIDPVRSAGRTSCMRAAPQPPAERRISGREGDGQGAGADELVAAVRQERHRHGQAPYGPTGGTSLAAPVVASVVALSKAQTGRKVGLGLPVALQAVRYLGAD